MIKYLPANEIGEDYVCGDLHGHRQLLMEKLDHLGFDFGKDRLFCTGDLNDRGPDSFGTLGLVFEPWFHFVRGNHEEDLPGFIEYEFSKFPDWRPAYCDQDWLYGLNEVQIQHLKEKILPKLAEAPFALHVEGPQGFWVVHADRCEAGGYQNPAVLLDDEKFPLADDARQKESFLWSRRLFNQIPIALEEREGFLVAPGMEMEPGIGLTFVGHNIVARPTLYRSHFFVDTGVYLPGSELTMLRVSDLKTAINKFLEKG